VLDGKVGQGLLDKLDQHGIKGLAFLENGWREVTNNRRPVRSHEDIKGLKIRTTPNPFHIQAFQLLGANPVPWPTPSCTPRSRPAPSTRRSTRCPCCGRPSSTRSRSISP
jgi:TRAP-type C4-dicarboxylate transport system substrate-binding protein